MIPFERFDSSASSRPGQPGVRWFVAVIVVLFVPVVVMIGFVGLFADGQTIPERILLVVINPVASVSAAWAMLDDAFFKTRRKLVERITAVAVLANVISAVTLFAGLSDGDGEIPLILAIPSAAYLAYSSLLARR